jgi:hypothetical protein
MKNIQQYKEKLTKVGYIVYTPVIDDAINTYRLQDAKESDIPIDIGSEELEDHTLS